MSSSFILSNLKGGENMISNEEHNARKVVEKRNYIRISWYGIPVRYPDTIVF